MFVYTLSFLFAQTSLFSPIEFLVIIIVLYTFLYFTAPYPGEHLTTPPTATEKTSFLLRLQAAFNGEMTLWLVFWPYFLIMNLILITADSLAVISSISVSSWDDILLMAFSSSLPWTVAIWRCSWQTNSRIWAALARLMTVCAFVDYGLRVFIRIDFPREFFNCQEAILNYSTCF